MARTYEEGVAEYIRLLTVDETDAAERLWAELEPERDARYRARYSVPRQRIPKQEPTRFELHRCAANPAGMWQDLTIDQMRAAGFLEEVALVEREPRLPPLYTGGRRIKDAVMEHARITVALGCCRTAEIAATVGCQDLRSAA